MSGAPPILRFGVFELNLSTEELRKFGTLLKLAPQPFELLALLASQAGQVVTREQIQLQLWGDDTFVDFEQGMNHCIRQIRNVLSDNAETPRYIETVPRRGYRFIAPVEVVIAKSPESLLQFPAEPAAKSTDTASSHEPGPQMVAVATLPAPAVSEDVSAPGYGERTPSSRRWWLLSVLLTVAVVVAAFTGYRIYRGRGTQDSSGMPDARHRRTVAVLGLKNLAGDSDSSQRLPTALTAMLETELSAGDQLRVVSGAEVAQTKKEMHLADADSLTSDQLKRIRSALAADYVVVGSYLEEGGKLRVDLRLQDTKQGDVVASVKENGTDSVTGLDALVSDAGSSIRSKLGLPGISQDEVSGIHATRPGDPAAENYYQGLGKLRNFDALGAREQLEKAVEAQPDFAPAHLALAEALSALGYSKLARDEAEKAYQHSANLPMQERLLIEARYRELTGKWGQAIALYQTLWDSGKNNVDYGLSLARAQIKAGKGQEALATLQALRSLPQPERDDLRIDLEEANAEYALGNYEQEQAAADRAAQKADKLGGFALARARKAQAKALVYRGHPDEAIAMYRQFLSISQQLGDKGEIASSSNNIGSAFLQQGNLTSALELYSNALAANREIGNRKWEAGTLSNMGAAYSLQGNLQDSMKMYQQALEGYRQVDDPMNEGIVLNNIAELQFLSGDLIGARKTYDEAIAIDRRIQNRSNEAEALFGLGQVLTAAGDLAAARRTHEKALAIRTGLQEEDTVAQSKLALAAIELDENRANAAEQGARAAAQSFQVLKMRDREVEALLLLTRTLLAQGKQAEAAQTISQALAAASGIQNRALLLDLQLASAQVMGESNDPGSRAEAMQKLGGVLEDSAKLGYLQIQLQAALALALDEVQSGNKSAGLERLAALRKQATAKGYGLVARQAGAAQKNFRAAGSAEGIPFQPRALRSRRIVAVMPEPSSTKVAGSGSGSSRFAST